MLFCLSLKEGKNNNRQNLCISAPNEKIWWGKSLIKLVKAWYQITLLSWVSLEWTYCCSITRIKHWNSSKTLHPKYDNHLKLKYLLVFFTHFISWACLQLSEKENHQNSMNKTIITNIDPLIYGRISESYRVVMNQNHDKSFLVLWKLPLNKT